MLLLELLHQLPHTRALAPCQALGSIKLIRERELLLSLLSLRALKRSRVPAQLLLLLLELARERRAPPTRLAELLLRRKPLCLRRLASPLMLRYLRARRLRLLTQLELVFHEPGEFVTRRAQLRAHPLELRLFEFILLLLPRFGR